MNIHERKEETHSRSLHFFNAKDYYRTLHYNALKKEKQKTREEKNSKISHTERIMYFRRRSLHIFLM